MYRRSFLRAAGATAVGLSVATGTASAEHGDAKPDHVTLEYDESTLETYRPELATNHLEVQPSSLFSWTATSPEHDTDAHVFFAYYSHQRGLSRADSHIHDREPIYVFTDSDTGDLNMVVYSGYHWLAARSRGPPTDDSGNRPRLRVTEKWHHYTLTDEADGDVDLADLHDKHSPHLEDGSTAWLDTGWEDALAPGLCLNPWRMRSRSDWWQDDVRSYAFEAALRRAYLTIGLYGADTTDL